MVVSVRVESRARIAFQEDEGVWWCGGGIGEFSVTLDMPLGFSTGIFAHPLVPSSPSVQISRHNLLPHTPTATIPHHTACSASGGAPQSAMTEIENPENENASYSLGHALATTLEILGASRCKNQN